MIPPMAPEARGNDFGGLPKNKHKSTSIQGLDFPSAT